MKSLMLMASAIVVLSGCIVTTASKDYSVDDVEGGARLPYKKVTNLDSLESFEGAAIPIEVKAENSTANIYSSGGVHGLLWLCTLGIIPAWDTELETHTITVTSPLGEKNGVCKIKKSKYMGWVPYMLPFGASKDDVLCEDELTSRIVSQWKGDWTADNVAKMNAANKARIEELRAKADDLLAKKDWAAVVEICKGEKNKAFVSEYMHKANAVRIAAMKQTVDAAMQKKDYQKVIDLLKDAMEPELIAKRGEATVNLIACSADEARCDELMKKYGGELTVLQLAEIGKKATNDIVRAKIVEETDRKIVKQIESLSRKMGDEKDDEEIDRLDKKIQKTKNELMALRTYLSYQVLECLERENYKGIESILAGGKSSSPKEQQERAQIRNFVNVYKSSKEACEKAKKRFQNERPSAQKQFVEMIGMIQTEGIQVDVVKKYDPYNFRDSIEMKEMIALLVPKLTPAAIAALYDGKACSYNRTTGFISEESDESEALFKAIPEDKLLDCYVAFASNGRVISEIAERMKKAADKDAIISRIVKLLNEKKISEKAVMKYVKTLNDGEATIALYNVSTGALKTLVFGKLSEADKKTISEGDSAKCRQMIAAAKDKSKETFEMGGFYLGMDIEDAELLFRFYFPEIEMQEKRDGKSVDAAYIIDIKGQRAPFCYASAKDKKIYQFNFGKKVLKKWHSYDVQTFGEWARAYSRENKIDMKYKEIEKEATVYDSLDLSQSYRVWFHQESYQYRHNTKDYRLTYFGEEREYTFHGGINGALIKEQAEPQFRYTRGDPGSLRVCVEKD